MPTILFSIGGEETDISGKSSKEVLDLVKKEYKKKVEEKEEEEEPKKNNCVSVKYEVYSDFRCPYDLKKVFGWWVKYNTLYIVVNEGDEAIEFDPYYNCVEQYDFKRPDEVEIVEEEDIGYDEE